MRLSDYLDKGMSLGRDAPCMTMGEYTRSYGDVHDDTVAIAGALQRAGIETGDRVAVLSANDPRALTCVFGISRAGAVWCPVNPRNEADENRQLFDLFGCRFLFFQKAFAELVTEIRDRLPLLEWLVCLDGDVPGALAYDRWLADHVAEPDTSRRPADGLCMIAGTGGTTGRPKGVRLTEENMMVSTATALMSYPFGERPQYLALAPLTHSAGVLTFPILSLGGHVVIMPAPDVGRFLELVDEHGITHAFLPPTVVYGLLDHPALDSTDLSSLRCLWYGAAPMSPTRLEEALRRIGPVLGQLFGQTEAPNMIATLAPADHFRDDGSIATERLASAGRPTPLTTVAIMSEAGLLLGPGERGEIVVRGPLVMAGYHENPDATAEVGAFGWHHTGDIGYLDDDNFLYIVDRAKDMIISGGFNVYSAEVEQALLAHPAVKESAVVGLPDDKWGERVSAAVQLRPDRQASETELIAFVKKRIGSMKAPKQIEIWDDLPRSKVGKILKTEVRTTMQLHSNTKGNTP
ncbi:AMP-dependent acyl-CoA synthetase [Rhodococcus sp. RS1C4]|uniref:AMP-binding protein n=1 Tax=Nocardiaceae TaxID=85025 RepID=UPI00035FCB30|nr:MULTISPECIES: AMP-binding protein [Rhodococcus]OZC45911.1 AMP-dependent acyl-CoA synthetase [Rhodococcus sp. 06-621-2]OZC48511.1 AMP-dependent acyl-CoA synthetase [Rhodococcus sp. RS1C4]OZC85349.1 AMP-dependent acyl-CoA synthetase [Rhodococcus sp. 06-418-1B]OZD12687.1 AMP-dependent acyl-CoA synthetase [Rhodococcus sp. 06-156-4C]OZD24309.1 AMP-dependent acyl-CoA synthetase [Rhodococcus sp. 06-156-3C]